MESIGVYNGCPMEGVVGKRKMTISIDDSAYANLERLARSPLTASGILSLAAGALKRSDIAALLCDDDFEREPSAARDRLWNLLAEHEREIRRRIGEFPRNVSEEDARQQVRQEVGDDHGQEIRELIAEIERDVHEEIDAEER